jgi:hypothetical protein
MFIAKGCNYISRFLPLHWCQTISTTGLTFHSRSHFYFSRDLSGQHNCKSFMNNGHFEICAVLGGLAAWAGNSSSSLTVRTWNCTLCCWINTDQFPTNFSLRTRGAETWTLPKVDQKYLESFEMWCWRRMEKISWTDRVRNEEVLHRVLKRETGVGRRGRL